MSLKLAQSQKRSAGDGSIYRRTEELVVFTRRGGGGDGTIGFERAIYRRMEGLNETSQAGGPG